MVKKVKDRVKGLVFFSTGLVSFLALASCATNNEAQERTTQGLEQRFERLDQESQQNKELVSYLAVEAKTLEKHTNSYAAKLGESFHKLEQGVARATEEIGTALKWVNRLSGKEETSDPLEVDPADQEKVKTTY